MTRRRSLLALLALTVALATFAWWATTESAALFVAQAEYVFPDPMRVDEEQMLAYQLLSIRAVSLAQLVPWVVLAALVAGIASLVLLALSGREGQAGSASAATASRDASAA